MTIRKFTVDEDGFFSEKEIIDRQSTVTLGLKPPFPEQFVVYYDNDRLVYRVTQCIVTNFIAEVLFGRCIIKDVIVSLKDVYGSAPHFTDGRYIFSNKEEALSKAYTLNEELKQSNIDKVTNLQRQILIIDEINFVPHKIYKEV